MNCVSELQVSPCFMQTLTEDWLRALLKHQQPRTKHLFAPLMRRFLWVWKYSFTRMPGIIMQNYYIY